MDNKVSLLAVDDDPNMLEGLAEVLELEGFSVCTASSAADALQAAKSQPPDAVLTDFQLPDSTGFELSAKLTGQLPGLPVFLLTGRTLSPQEKEAGRASGVREFVVKPFDMPQLVALLKTMAPRRDKQ